VRYDVADHVYHHIQARRLEPGWLLSRLYWQGASTVLTGVCCASGRGVARTAAADPGRLPAGPTA